MEKVREVEFYFIFRGKSIGVEATSLESAYGHFYSEYSNVSKEELDEAYQGNQAEQEALEYLGNVAETILEENGWKEKNNKLYNIYLEDDFEKRVYLTTTDDFEKWLEESNKWRVADGIEPESADSFVVREANLQLFNKERGK